MTGSEPGKAEPAGQDPLPHDRQNERDRLAQSPSAALKSLVINGAVTLIATAMICAFPLFLFQKAMGIEAWDFMRENAGSVAVEWIGASIVVLTLTFLVALYVFRGLFRLSLLPILRGGFDGEPCLFANNEGFIDTRILREPVRWENINNRKRRGIGDHHFFGIHIIDVFLKKPVRTLKRNGRGSTRLVLVLAGSFDWRTPPYDLLARHYKSWRDHPGGGTTIANDGNED